MKLCVLYDLGGVADHPHSSLFFDLGLVHVSCSSLLLVLFDNPLDFSYVIKKQVCCIGGGVVCRREARAVGGAD